MSCRSNPLLTGVSREKPELCQTFLCLLDLIELRAVPGGDGRDDRHQGQDHRVIPWRHDADDAKRLVFDASFPKTHVQRDVSAGWAHECAKIATQILDTLDEPATSMMAVSCDE